VALEQKIKPDQNRLNKATGIRLRETLEHLSIESKALTSEGRRPERAEMLKATAGSVLTRRLQGAVLKAEPEGRSVLTSGSTAWPGDFCS
jgi:hypothetical protein